MCSLPDSSSGCAVCILRLGFMDIAKSLFTNVRAAAQRESGAAKLPRMIFVVRLAAGAPGDRTENAGRGTAVMGTIAAPVPATAKRTSLSATSMCTLRQKRTRQLLRLYVDLLLNNNR